MEGEKEPVLVVWLAHSGGRVLIPDAVGTAGDEGDTVDFIDKDGRVLVTFERKDVALFSMSDRLPGTENLTG